MLSQIRKRNEGFTIIEVLIVLAIAGLILLVVFLAVPALQRNSRNTQRKSDVARVGGSVQEYINNNNGALPTSSSNGTLQAQLGKLAYYTNTNVTVVGAATTTVTNGTTVDTVNVFTGATCGTMTGGLGAVSTGANARSIAVVYTSEGGSSNPLLCTTF